MPAITGTDLTIIRQHPSAVTRYLSFAPLVSVFTCQVNGAALVDNKTGGVYGFNFDNPNGVSGDVLPGFTVWIGTTAGARDIGVTRVRKAIAGSTFYIAETAYGKLPIADNHYITVFEDIRPWVKSPRLVGIRNSSGYISSFTEYHDYDEAYTNQNTQIKPKANITRSATNRSSVRPAGMVDTGQTYRTVVLSSAFSQAIATGATISSRLWDVDDGTIIVGTATDTTITVRFPQLKEFRWISLTVTDSNGKTDKMYWPIWVHHSANMPLGTFTVTNDTRGEGREMSFEIFGSDDSADETVIPEGTLVCYWEQTTFGADNAPDQYIDQFIGWTMRDSVTIRRFNTSRYVIDVGGVQSWLSQFNGYAQKISDKTPVNRWFKMNNLTVERVAHYILREYTTVLNISNLFFAGITTTVKAEEFKKSNVWGQLVELIRGNSFCNVACDSLGAIWFRKDYNYLELADRASIAIIINLMDSDLTDSKALQISEEKKDKVSIVSLSGSFVSANKNKLVHSKAPGLVPANSGSDEEAPFQRVGTGGQNLINKLSGHHYAKVNNPRDQVDLELIGNLDIFERAWGEIITITWTSNNIRGIIVNTEEFVIDQVTVAHSTEFGTPPKRINLRVSSATLGRPGVSYFPPQNNNQGIALPTFRFPKIDFPRFLPQDWITMPPSVPKIAAICASTGAGEDLHYEADPFDVVSPTWVQKTLPGVNLNGFGSEFTVDPFSPFYLGTGTTVNCYWVTNTRIYRITDLFGSPTQVSQYTFPSAIALHLGSGHFRYSRAVSGWLVLDYKSTSTTANIIYTTDGGITWTPSSLSISVDPAHDGFDMLYVSDKTPGLVYVAYEGSLWKSTNYGASFTQIFNPADVGTPVELISGTWKHVPLHNNPGENIIYFSDGSNAVLFMGNYLPANQTNFLYRVDINDIPNSIEQLQWPGGPGLYSLDRFTTAPTDSNRAIAIMSGMVVQPLSHTIVTSYNGGKTWLHNRARTTDALINGIKISTKNPDYIYVYGNVYGTPPSFSEPNANKAYLAVTRNFFLTLEERNGNIHDFTSPASTYVMDLVGIAL